MRRTLTARDRVWPKAVILAVLTALMAMFFPDSGSPDLPYSVGSVWVDRDLIAPFSFPIARSLPEYQKEIDSAEHSVEPVFDPVQGGADAAFEAGARLVRGIGAAAALYSRRVPGKGGNDSAGFAAAAAALPVTFTAEEWKFLSGRTGARSDVPREMLNAIAPGVREILTTGLIDRDGIKEKYASIAVRRADGHQIVSSSRIHEPAGAEAIMRSLLGERLESQAAVTASLKIVRRLLIPTLLFNAEETNRLLEAARGVVPRTSGFVRENERIVARHERITSEVKLKLESYQRMKAERSVDAGQIPYRIGTVLHVAIILALYGLYIFLFRKGLFRDNMKLILIGLIILLEGFFAWLSVRLELEEPIQYLIFVPAASMLLTMIFDSRMGFYGTVVVAFLVAGIRGNDYAIAFTSLVAGGFGAYSVRDIRQRTQIFRSLVFILLGYALAIVALSLQQFESPTLIGWRLAFALANAVFSPVLTYGLLIFFEKAFRVTTDLTLLELSDFNHPLLLMLSERAPGTFHHSMVLGNLSAAAAEAIGANPILARVGAYYHDIGKSQKPEYFVENQQGNVNKHNRLRPRMSALILASHVKEGAELGREYGLPEKIIDFIEQHHGTNRISFFYEKALKQAARKGEESSVREEDFLYPGPKPQSKEAGIVMLADSVEASIRSMEHMTAPKLNDAIERMIRTRFVEGQLDECELTFRDLSKIRDAFLKILVGIHHQRIRYEGEIAPEPPPEPPMEKARESNAAAGTRAVRVPRDNGEPESAGSADQPASGTRPGESSPGQTPPGEAGEAGEARED